MTPIDTRLGRVTGRAWNDVTAFLGLRFAEPPTGPRRFKAPVRSGGWTGTYDATQFRNRSIQPPVPADSEYVPEGQMDEDCLFLNVYTPAADDRARPVMLWLHGGSHVSGSGNGADGSILAARGDVVVVPVNYRLGLFGFLDLSAYGNDYAGSGSNGILDHVAALEWVRDNIADYGGDPGNVTIFGVSAGATSVHLLMGTPKADGLYHRAIAFSSAGLDRTEESTAPELAEALDVGPDDLVDALANLSGPDIEQIGREQGVSGSLGVDGTVVTRGFGDAIRHHGADGVPHIAGFCRDEATIWTAWMDDAQMDDVARGSAFQPVGYDNAAAYLKRMRDDGIRGRELANRVVTDMFKRPAVEAAETSTKAGPGGWLYRFDLESTEMTEKLGAPHGADVVFTFNDYANPRPNSAKGLYASGNPAAPDVANRWQDTVARFAHTGDPNGDGIPAWRPYGEPHHDVLLIDSEPVVRSMDFADERRHWGWTG